jgi:hypothetical protein
MSTVNEITKPRKTYHITENASKTYTKGQITGSYKVKKKITDTK